MDNVSANLVSQLQLQLKRINLLQKTNMNVNKRANLDGKLIKMDVLLMNGMKIVSIVKFIQIKMRLEMEYQLELLVTFQLLEEEVQINGLGALTLSKDSVMVIRAYSLTMQGDPLHFQVKLIIKQLVELSVLLILYVQHFNTGKLWPLKKNVHKLI